VTSVRRRLPSRNDAVRWEPPLPVHGSAALLTLPCCVQQSPPRRDLASPRASPVPRGSRGAVVPGVSQALLAGRQQEAGGCRRVPDPALHEESLGAEAPLRLLFPRERGCVRLNRVGPGQLPNLDAGLLHEADPER